MAHNAYRFTIKDVKPQELPIAELIGFLEDLAAMFADAQRWLHLVGIEEGSTNFMLTTDPAGATHLENQVRHLKSGGARKEARDGQRRVAERLGRLGTRGTLHKARGTAPHTRWQPLLDVPGTRADAPAAQERPIGPIRDEGTIDGQVIRVGGQQDPCSAQIKVSAGTVVPCAVSRALAVELGCHLFQRIRAFGTGDWLRYPGGTWEQKSFTITRFVVLDDTPLLEVVEKLQALGGGDWADDPDPWETLRLLRHGEGEPH